jgi:hypothetical protein
VQERTRRDAPRGALSFRPEGLLTVSEGEIRVAAPADINVLQGEPEQFEIELPSGYEMTGATGGSIDSTEEKDGVLTVRVTNPAQHSNQFLITLEKSIDASSIEAPFLAFKGTQREIGGDSRRRRRHDRTKRRRKRRLKRMDLKELNPLLRSIARNPMHAAFRYHRQPGDTPKLALAWTRFTDSSVLAGVVERAIATTLVTNEGKSHRNQTHREEPGSARTKQSDRGAAHFSFKPAGRVRI